MTVVKPSIWFERNPKKTLLLVISGGVLGILILLELSTRVMCPEINFMGTSSNLFVYKVYGTSYANAKNVVASSLGTTIITDSYGFRIDPEYDYRVKQDLPSIIFLGDSVVFGAGVAAKKTFVELTNQKITNYRIINAAVMGYNVNDYKNIVDYFFSKNKDKFKIKHMILGLCLNDIQTISNSNILNNVPAGSKSLKNHLINKLKSWYIGFDELLKSHSKLLILLKSYFSDRGRDYFQYEAQAYYSKQLVKDMMEPLIYLNQVLVRNDILFTIIIQPYEYQLRVQNTYSRYPINVIKNKFDANNIDYLDGYEFFVQEMQTHRLTSKEFYLFNDAMHFSKEGHQVMYKLIQNIIKND